MSIDTEAVTDIHHEIQTSQLESGSDAHARPTPETNGHPRERSESTSHPNAHHPVLIVVMGVAGTGKTTLAKALNAKLDMPYIEGDDLHPKTSIAKMSSGQALTDADREPWLELIRTTAEHMIVEQQADPDYHRREGAMVTCSALKKYYRNILRGIHLPEKIAGSLAAPEAERVSTYFVYIKEEVELLKDRMAKREGHFMKPQMLDSQLATLESPEGEEGVVVVPLAASTDEQVRIALEGLTSLAGPL